MAYDLGYAFHSRRLQLAFQSKKGQDACVVAWSPGDDDLGYDADEEVSRQTWQR